MTPMSVDEIVSLCKAANWPPAPITTPSKLQSMYNSRYARAKKNTREIIRKMIPFAGKFNASAICLEYTLYRSFACSEYMLNRLTQNWFAHILALTYSQLNLVFDELQRLDSFDINWFANGIENYTFAHNSTPVTCFLERRLNRTHLYWPPNLKFDTRAAAIHYRRHSLRQIAFEQ